MPTDESEEPRTPSDDPGRRPAPSRPSARRFRPPPGIGRRWLRGCWWTRPAANPGPTPVNTEAHAEADLRALMVMASHDLKSPLASVTAHIDMLRVDYADALGDGFARDLAAIERGLHRMTRLTQDLLSYAQADHTLTTIPVSLSDLVAEVVAEHTGTAAGPPEIAVAETLPEVLADAALLRHVLDNLIGNAIKYTRPGARPRITISARPQTDGSTLVEVTDSGIGIPATDRSRIFDPFHRCANTAGYPGTGLGLAICKRIIERHGGRIDVTENPDGGSRFWFTLPTSTSHRDLDES